MHTAVDNGAPLRKTMDKDKMEAELSEGALKLSIITAGWSWTDVACAVGAGAVAVVVAPAVLTAVGFTSAGVAAGSLAAATQSAVYGGYVASGSAFALAQSAGAAGIGVKGAVAIVTAVGGTTMYAKKD